MFRILMIFLIFLICFDTAYAQALSNICHPKIDPKFSQYIIGYGSLIQEESKNQTSYNTSENIPVRVYGYQRGWFMKGSGITYLGIKKDKHTFFNGVIFKLSTTTAIYNYDQREKNYCRVSVSPHYIDMLNHRSIPRGQFWVYIPEQTSFAMPTSVNPIKQSYADIFLSGCFEIQKKYHLKTFANQCVKTTKYWSPYWINNRIYTQSSCSSLMKIDKLLEKNLTKNLKNHLANLTYNNICYK